jgi:cobalamin biosynthesis protein CobD/CbiB
MAAIAGALRVQLEKPSKYVVGDPIDELTPNKIMQALKIRDISIVLCALLALPIFIAIGLYLPLLWGLPI